jgi:LytR cell envelope-related transcriptional attenuator
VTAPWHFAGERVRLVQPDADTLWKLLREDRTLDGQSTAGTGAATASASPTATPATGEPLTAEQAAAPVTVVNGVGTSGLAGSGAEALRARGFQNVTLGANNPGRQQTEVAYDPALKAAADQVAALFPGARTVEDPGSGAVTVTLGPDYRPAGTRLDSVSTPGATPPAAPGATPGGIPTGIAENTRGADTDPCADLTFGS